MDDAKLQELSDVREIATGHPIIRSLEPGEDWFWCYEDEVAFELER